MTQPFSTAQVYFNVKDYGALGDGVTDDRPAIQLAFNAAIAAGGGCVFFPSGKYPCVVTDGGAIGIPTFAFFGPSTGNILFLGEGRSSHIVMAGDGTLGDRRLFDIRNGCKHIGFKNLKMSSELINEHEQQHLLHFDNQSSSAELETGRAIIVNCYFGHTRGDAIRFLGNDTKRIKHVLVKRCIFDMTSAPGARSRSAFSFQRASDDIILDANWTGGGGSSIEFEPSGTGSNERMIITRNIFSDTSGATQLTGNGPGQPHTQSIVSYNHALQLAGLDLQNMIVCSNIVNNENSLADGVVAFQERIFNMTVCDNLIYQANNTATATVLAFFIHSAGTVGRNIVVTGNMCVNEKDAEDGGVVSFQDTSDIVCADNLLIFKLSVADKGAMVKFEDTTQPEHTMTCRGNLGVCTNQRSKRGFVGGPYNTTVADNLLRNINSGVTYGGVLEQCTVTRNILQATAASPVLLTSCNHVAVDGAGGPTGPTVYECIVTPENNVDACVGSLALRSTGGGAGTTMYVKESSPTTTTGWIGK